MKKLLLALLLLLPMTFLFSTCEEKSDPTPKPCETHTWGGWMTKTAASCVEGVKQRTCNACGKAEEAPLPATGIHSYSGGICTICGKHQPTEGLSFTATKNGEAFSVNGTGTATGATKIVVPDTHEGKPVTEIGNMAFMSQKNLKTLILPDSITKIGDSAFDGCSALTSFTVPSSLTEVGESAFYAAVELKTVYVDSLDTWLGIAFEYDTESSPLAYNGTLFVDGQPLEHLVLPAWINKISANAFVNCKALKSVSFAKGSACKTIGWGAFSNCTALTSVAFPEGLESLNSYAFKGCTNLTSLTLPSTVTSLGTDVFSGCTKLNTLVLLPKSIFVPNGTFRDCLALQAVYYGGSEAEWAGVEIYPYNNTAFENAMRYYFSEEKPSADHQSFWRFQNGVPTRWQATD